MASAWIYNRIDSRYDLGAFRLVFALALVLLFVENSWAACTQATSYFYRNSDNLMNGTCDPGSIIAPSGSCSNSGGTTYRYSCRNNGAPYMTDFKFDRCQSYGEYGYYTYYSCSSLCEAKEYECNKKGWSWDAANCVCNDPTLCASYREQCEEIGGKFNGLVSDGCCRAVCNICGGESFTKLYDMKRKICCDRMQSPPLEQNVCYTNLLPPAECGMNWSDIKDLTSAEWACRDPSLSAEAAQNYREQCFERSSSSTDDHSSSSGGADGSSSSGGGDGSSSSGASPYPEGCEECPWLDSILDTLTLQKQKVDEIYSCLTIPGLCGETAPASSSGTPVPIDSSAVPLLDSANRLGEKQLLALQELDSLLKKLNRKDSIALMNDSNTWQELYFITNIITEKIQTSNDTTRKWMSRIFERMKSTNDTLKNHLDSLKFSFVDTSISSLNDSAVKYFQLGLKYDSIYNKVFKDSIKSIHDAITDIGVNIGYNLGYGDTASKTMREDLENIGGSIVSLDSSLNGTLRHYLTGAAVDTGGVSYGNGFVASGQRIADSVKSVLGWGYVDTLDIDSMYARALSGYLSGYKGDSISQDVQDSLNDLAVRLNDSLIAKTDSIKNALPAVLDSMADSLVLWAPFADFDSIIYSSIGAHIPNRSECPEACQKWTVSIPIIGLHSYTVDFGLCLGRASFAGLSVLGFLKLLIRIIVAYTCIMTIGRVLVRMI